MKISSSPGGSVVFSSASKAGFIQGFTSTREPLCASRSAPMSKFESRKPWGVKLQRPSSAHFAQPFSAKTRSVFSMGAKSAR